MRSFAKACERPSDATPALSPPFERTTWRPIPSPLRAKLPSADWESIDEVILGCANQAGGDNRNIARMALLLAGLPASVPGVTANRLCASGLEAVASASRSIAAGKFSLGIAGGVESMSRDPAGAAEAHRLFAKCRDL